MSLVLLCDVAVSDAVVRDRGLPSGGLCAAVCSGVRSGPVCGTARNTGPDLVSLPPIDVCVRGGAGPI
ncbi:hypothetical protein Kisp01_45190 [Kineosporia sp. NBRC 101677]|nr:hypothetical protein Kisp01_45190 [Kineosporia sp. NBRC 101677]